MAKESFYAFETARMNNIMVEAGEEEDGAEVYSEENLMNVCFA